MSVFGDDALECETCGRRFHLMRGNTTPKVRETIAAACARQWGPEAGEAFRVALDEVIEDARRCFNEIPAFLGGIKPVIAHAINQPPRESNR